VDLVLRRALGCAAMVLVFPATALSDTIPPPTVTVVVDGLERGTANLTQDPESGGWELQYFWENPDIGRITMSGLLDPDPALGYAAAVTDFGAPSVFGFLFGLPIVPTAAPGVVTHSESSSTTDFPGSAAGTAVTALAPPLGIPVDGDLVTEQFVYTLSQDGGLNFLNAGLDIRPSFVGASPSDTQAAVNLGPIAGPGAAGFYNFMRVDVNFSMTGGGDAYTWNGVATVVPEPATAALFGMGLGGLALFGRRRREADRS
jgi:hypothetical protein